MCDVWKSLALSTDGELSRPASCSDTEREDEEEAEDEEEVGRSQLQTDPVLYFFGGYVGSVSGNAVINESACVRSGGVGAATPFWDKKDTKEAGGGDWEAW